MWEVEQQIRRCMQGCPSSCFVHSLKQARPFTHCIYTVLHRCACRHRFASPFRDLVSTTAFQRPPPLFVVGPGSEQVLCSPSTTPPKPRQAFTSMTILNKAQASRPCLLLAAVAALALSVAHANGPCSLPMNARRQGAAGCAASTAGNGANGGYPSPPCYFGMTAARTRHNTPVLSFRQPKESLVRLKELGGKVKGKVGQAVEGLKHKWDARRSNKNNNNENVKRGKKAKENASITHVRVERSLFRCAPVSLPPPDREEDEECPPGQDTLHHPHPQFQGEKEVELSSPCSSPGDAAFDDDGALFVLGRTQSFDTALLRDAEARSRRRRGAVSYGNRLVNFVGFSVKLLTLLLFQVLGTALVVNEYQTTGIVSETLMKFASLLAGLAFVPPSWWRCVNPSLPMRGTRSYGAFHACSSSL